MAQPAEEMLLQGDRYETEVRGTITVLHVDDDPDFGDLTATYLERESDLLEVVTLHRVEDALDRLGADDIDCIVSDYDMPGTNGIEFLEAVREEHPELPFILYTGKGSEEVASDAISAGVTDYLQKESRPEQYTLLANRITNAVERYRSQQMVERSQKRLREIIDTLPLFLYVVDEDGTYLLANDALASFHDATVEEIEGSDVADVLGESVAEQFRSNVEDVLEAGTIRRFSEVEIPDPNGERHVFEPRLRPYDFGDTGTGAVLGIAADVTERNEHERRLETVISNLPGIVYRCSNDPTWPMEFVRGQCESLTGYPAEVLERGDVVWGEDVLHPDDRDRMWEAVQSALEEDRPFEVTYRICTADGAVKWMWERGRRVTRSPDGDTVLEGFITDITDRKRQNQELEQTNALLSTLINTLPEGILAEDESREVLTVNDRMFDLFEMPGSPTEVTGADCEQLARAVSGMFAGSDQFVERINDLIAESEPADDEELALADGRAFERSYRPIELPDGDGHLWVYRDITDRKERERRYNAVFNQTYQYTGLLEPDGTLIKANRTALDFGGFEREEVIGKKMWEVDWFQHSEETQRRARNAIERAADGEFVRLELPVQGDDRDAIIDFSVRPITNDEGEVTLLVPEGREITERKEYEQTLREEREQIEKLFDTSPVGIVILDMDGLIVRANERAEVVLGLTNSDIVGRRYDDPSWKIVDEEGASIPAEDLPFARVMATGEPVFNYEHGIKWSDGTEKWVSANVAPIRADSGEIEQVIAAITDVTEQREYEATIEDKNERLDEFASIVSHDLRNPLNVAQLRLELAQEQFDSEHLDAIGRAHERMETLVTDLLTLAREGESVTDVSSVDCENVIEDCWRNVDTGGATLVTDLTRTVRANESRLRQLFENLMRNAIEQGGEDVTVTVGGIDDGLYVEDDGPGIPESDRERVFEDGYSSSSEGTGFGLSIVEQVVEAHGWEIRVTDGEEGGARFEITGVDFE